MISHRAGEIAKTGLPQDGVVEEPLDEYHVRVLPDLLPAIQAALGAWQEAVRRRRSREAAAIQIAFQRKDNAAPVCVVANGSDQTGMTHRRERVDQMCQPTSQTTAARRVTNSHVLDQFRRADSASIQIDNRLTVTV